MHMTMSQKIQNLEQNSNKHADLTIIYPPGTGGQFLRMQICEHLGIEQPYTISAHNEYRPVKFNRSQDQTTIEAFHFKDINENAIEKYTPAIIVIYNPANFWIVETLRQIKAGNTGQNTNVHVATQQKALKTLQNTKNLIGKLKPALVVQWEKLFADLEVQPLCDFVGIEDVASFRLQCKEYHAKNMELINMYK